VVTGYAEEWQLKPLLQRVAEGNPVAALARWESPAEGTDVGALFRKDPDELETVQESHAMADYSAQGLEFSHFRDGELERNHFPGTKLAGYDCPQPVLCDFEAAAMDAEISVLPQHFNDERQLGTVARIPPCRRFVHVRRTLAA
jgi:hypothetical protein